MAVTVGLLARAMGIQELLFSSGAMLMLPRDMRTLIGEQAALVRDLAAAVEELQRGAGHEA